MISCSKSSSSEIRTDYAPNVEPISQATLEVTQKSNTAIVISQHANLRDADNSGASVLQIVPQDSSVEVIKQQGGWSYVKTETVQGWMHGNTLKLQNFEIKQKSDALNIKPLSETPKQITEKQTISEISQSDTGLRIKGNNNSIIYHLPDCSSYNRIASHNINWFKLEKSRKWKVIASLETVEASVIESAERFFLKQKFNENTAYF